MNNLNLKNIVEELLDTFLEAGKIAKEISRRGVKITIKTDNSPVTDGDLAVDQLLRSKIANLTPNILKKDEYTLNAALIVNLKPAVGVVYAPGKDRLFFSYGKNLAFQIYNGKKTVLNCKKIYTNEIIALANSNKTPTEVLDIYKKYKVSQTIRMSSSLKFCILAAGEADIYAAKARAYEWDIAAGHAVLEHAGGLITTFDEKNFLYGKKNYKNLTILAKRCLNLEK